MELIIEDTHKCDIFVGLFQHIKFMTEHINIVFQKEQFYVQCMDNSHVAIMELTLPKTWFDTYDNQSLDSIMVGVNVGIFYRILSAREKSQKIHLVYSLDKNDSLAFHLTSENSKTVFDKHFEMPLIDIDAEFMSIPNMEYQAEMTLAATQFHGIVHQLKMFGDTMDISCSENSIVLASQSNNQGKMSVEIKIEDLTEFSIEEDKTLELSFSLGYLHNILQYHKLVSDVSLGFSDSTPMCLRYHLGGVSVAMATDEADNNSPEDPAQAEVEAECVPSLKFYLAPKLNDD